MKDIYTNKVGLVQEGTAAKSAITAFTELINLLIKTLSKLGVLRRISIIMWFVPRW
jgi:hypothetical protein